MAVLLALAAAPAYADVQLYVTVYKEKDVSIYEEINVSKDIDIDATVDIDVLSSAEADAYINQENFTNRACENCAEKTDTIFDSVNENAGIATVNQAAGNNNNQASSIAVAVDARVGQDGDTNTEDGFGHAQAHAEQDNFANLVDAVNIIFRDALIDTSINDNLGIVHVNQATGNMNNQGNALAIGVSLVGDGVALAEADLGQVNCNNTVFESDSEVSTEPGFGINKTATITDSVINNQGVVGVNQTAGNMANQANVVAIAAAQ
jgi:hypothetical protein